MLTKPGIIFGNVVTASSGFVLASKGHFDFWLFFAAMLGLSLVVASAGVFNNYIDRIADAKMNRTRLRALPQGAISEGKALVFATILCLAAIAVLALWTNPLSLAIALTGFFVYLLLYSFLKYRSFYGTIIGSVAGGIPPLVGYAAVSNTIDIPSLILFFIVVLWQMPHFFAIAIYRLEDYARASIPVLPLTHGTFATKVHMLMYIVAFMLMTLLLPYNGYMGYLYATIAATLGFGWLAICLYGFYIDASQNKRWARNMFLYSLIVIMALSLATPFDVKIGT